MGMTVNVTKELIRCSICNNIVPKQRYCPKCGKLLIKTIKNTPLKVEEPVTEKPSPEKADEEVENSPVEQLEKLREKIKNSENERRESIDHESSDNDLLTGVEQDKMVKNGDEYMVRNKESKDIVINDDDESINFSSAEGEVFAFTPDKYTAETVQKTAKNVRYESYLVNLLKEDEITEETFLGLYNGIADDTHKMIMRRGEIITEIETAVKGYRSTIISAQQGMKLLDIRKSINDASEDEYQVKAAALKWDIDNYGRRVNEEEQKATYLKNLGKLIDSKELNNLISDVNNSLNILSKLNVSEDAKSKIHNSMREVISLLKETDSK